jgi:hypothetical protein
MNPRLFVKSKSIPLPPTKRRRSGDPREQASYRPVNYCDPFRGREGLHVPAHRNMSASWEWSTGMLRPRRW